MNGTQATAVGTVGPRKGPVHRKAGTHGEPLRGLMSTTGSHLLQGRFGKIFRVLPAADFGATVAESEANLMALGKKMSSVRDPADPKDGPDDEESGIPALYTYFGQFIDHDITFDPNSSLQKFNDPDALVDYRTPAFDLDSLYGRGPSDQPYLYDDPNDGTAQLFLLGSAITGGTDPDAKDLPRNTNPKGRARALIGDPRNDENAIVSQLQGLFLRFHNRIAKDNGQLSFGEVQRLVRFHYQYLVLNDFLPRIVHHKVLHELKTHEQYDRGKMKFFRPRHEPFMPVEFSVAAYRLGHSMVRPGYRLNDATLLPIFSSSGPDLRGFQPVDSSRAIDWGRLIDLEPRPDAGSDAAIRQRLQFAYKIDTSLADPLSNLPDVVASDPPPSLAQRNLLRGWRLGLPSGQSVARAMGIKPLADTEILIGKAVKGGDPASIPITGVKPDFAGNCPLWTYILAEAMHHQEDVSIPVIPPRTIKTPKLGPVGGRIVAEVFLGLIFGDSNSMLNQDPLWEPDKTDHPTWQPTKDNPKYQLKNLVRYALGK